MKFEQASIKILEELDKKGDQFTKKEDLEKIKIGKNKFGEVLNYLSHKGTVIGDDHGAKWRISPAQGRDYLSTYKSQRAQEKFNGILAITGAILALTAIYDFLMSFDSLENNKVIKSVFIILIFLCFASIIPFIINYWKKEVLGR